MVCSTTTYLHREDASFHYKWEFKSGIPVSDDFYDIVLEVLKDCLKQKPLDGYHTQNSSTKETSKQDSGRNEQKGDSNTNESEQDSANINGDGVHSSDIEKIR